MAEVITTVSTTETETAITFPLRVRVVTTREDGPHYVAGHHEVFVTHGSAGVIRSSTRRQVFPIQKAVEEIITEEVPNFLAWPRA